MTIALSANTPRVSYTVSQGATQTSFTVPFVFFTASTDLNVFVDGTERTFDASTSSTTLYTVSGGNGSTGTVTTSVTGVTGGSTVVITRDIPLSRTTDFPSSGAFEIAKLNTELDTVTAIQSDFNDNVDRTIRLQEFDDAATMTLPLKDARKGTVLGFNATTGAVEAGPTITAVQSLSDVTASIALLGTSAVVTDMGLLATSANVTAMGHLGTSANVTAMGLLGTSAVVADMALLGTSDVVADMALLATTDVIADMAQLANTTIIDDLAQLANTTITDDMAILATSDNVTAMGVLGTSANVTAMGLLGTSAVVEDMGFLGTSANVTAMGHLGTSANVTAMGLLGTSAVVTDMGILGTTAIVEDMGILATSANVTAMGLLGTSSNVTAMGLLGTSAVIEDLGLLATSAVIEDMGLLATSANITNMATLGASGVVTNIATVASNVSGVNSFADRYRVASSAPSSSLDVGDLYFDTTANELKVYKSSGWAAAGSTVNGTSERFTYNITGTPTTLTGASGTGFAEANSNTLAYDAGFIDVYLNGVKMVNGTDVTVTSGTSVVFASALSNGDVVDIVTFGTFNVANIVSTGALNSGSITSGFGNIDTGSSTITTTGAITGGSLVADNITIDGNDISSTNSDGDMLFKGSDGGSTITALTLDMSDAGTAIFNHDIKIADNNNIQFGSGADLMLSSDGTNGTIASLNGDITLDSADDIILDADGGDIILKDDGTQFGQLYKNGNDFRVESNVQDGDLVFTGNDGGSGVIALTFDMSESGDATFNSNIRTSAIIVQSSIGASGVARQTTASGSHVYTADQFRNSSGTQVGSIAVGTSATTYNTSSDYRLKQNVSYEFDATSRLKQLKPARFNWKKDSATTVDGFLAHEVSSVVPEAITGAKDATQKIQNVVLNADGSFLADNISEKKWKQGKATVDEDGKKIDPIYAEDTTWVASKTVPDYQQIDQSKLVPLLTKALQEQQATIEALTARITALENA